MREFIPLPERVRRAVLERGGRFRIEESALERPGPGEVVFRLLAAGVGPDDVAPNLYVNRTPPGVPILEVAAAGDGVSGWNALDRAILLPRPASTDPLPGLSTYLSIPDDPALREALVKLPGQIDAEGATLLPAAAFAARILREARSDHARTLLVLGLGLVGQVAIRLARHQGIRGVYAADASATLRQRAEWSGATRVIRVPEEPLRDAILQETGGAGPDAVLALSPDASLAHEAFQVMARRGTMVVGAPFSSNFLFALPGARVQRNELRIHGVSGFESQDLRDAFQALRLGTVNADTLVSRRLRWDELPQADLDPGYWEHGTHVVVQGPDDEDFPVE